MTQLFSPGAQYYMTTNQARSISLDAVRRLSLPQEVLAPIKQYHKSNNENKTPVYIWRDQLDLDIDYVVCQVQEGVYKKVQDDATRGVSLAYVALSPDVTVLPENMQRVINHVDAKNRLVIPDGVAKGTIAVSSPVSLVGMGDRVGVLEMTIAQMYGQAIKDHFT